MVLLISFASLFHKSPDFNDVSYDFLNNFQNENKPEVSSNYNKKVIVSFQKPSYNSTVRSRFEFYGGTILEEWNNQFASVSGFAGIMPLEVNKIAFQNEFPDANVENNDILEAQMDYASIQSGAVNSTWYLNGLKGDTDSSVAVLDTGIDHKHEDLSGKVVAEVDFTNNRSTNDRNGHGTHIAGIIAADADNDNDLGLIGVIPQANLLNVKVADDRGICQKSAVAAGIVWAVDNGANIINISLAIRETSKDLENAIDYAWENGCIIVAAANLGNAPLAYPAYFDKCIAVTVNREDNLIIPLIDNEHWVDVAAPGTRIYSTLPNNSYGIRRGASCSTALVSSVAAILYSTLDDDNENGKLNDDVRLTIENNYFDISPLH